ncbi:MAG: universal stress protein [Nocardioides sp.]|nr:universal stress protein [Nocardioides sp.]
MRSILVGVDRSDASRRAVDYAAQEARDSDCALKVVHVINWSRYSFTTNEDNASRPLERQREITTAQREVIDPLIKGIEGVDVTSDIRFGKPSEVLADVAKEEGHNLVFVARTGDSGLREAIFGSTASRLVQHAAVPVVVVP